MSLSESFTFFVNAARKPGSDPPKFSFTNLSLRQASNSSRVIFTLTTLSVFSKSPRFSRRFSIV